MLGIDRITTSFFYTFFLFFPFTCYIFLSKLIMKDNLSYLQVTKATKSQCSSMLLSRVRSTGHTSKSQFNPRIQIGKKNQKESLLKIAASPSVHFEKLLCLSHNFLLYLCSDSGIPTPPYCLLLRFFFFILVLSSLTVVHLDVIFYFIYLRTL